MTADAPADPITIEKPADLPGAPLRSVLGFDFDCTSCSYNLRGLCLNVNCPECGVSVTDSIRASHLLFQPIPYIHRLSKGALFCFAGWFAAFVWAALDVLFMISEYAFAYPNYLYEFLEIGSVLYLTVCAETAFIGLIMLSRRTPGMNKRQRNSEHSVWVLSLVAAITVPVLVTLLTFDVYPNIEDSMNGLIVVTAIGAAAFISILFCYFGGLQQVRVLCRLVPAEREDRIAVFLLWIPLLLLIPVVGMLALIVIMTGVPLLFFLLLKQFRMIETMALELQQLQHLAESSGTEERLFALPMQ